MVLATLPRIATALRGEEEMLIVAGCDKCDDVLTYQCMEQDSTLQKILISVEETQASVKEVRSSVEELRSSVEETQSSVKEVRSSVEETREVVDFLKDQMISRDEFENVMVGMKSEIISHVDGFVVLHQKLDAELSALRAKYERLEFLVQHVAKHAHIELPLS